jgi:hypothetical protein
MLRQGAGILSGECSNYAIGTKAAATGSCGQTARRSQADVTVYVGCVTYSGRGMVRPISVLSVPSDIQ